MARSVYDESGAATGAVLSLFFPMAQESELLGRRVNIAAAQLGTQARLGRGRVKAVGGVAPMLVIVVPVWATVAKTGQQHAAKVAMFDQREPVLDRGLP